MLPSLTLLLGVLTAPWVAAKTTLEFYTSGTIYQRTTPPRSDTQNDPEFQTLSKNLVVALIAHLSKHITLADVRFFPAPMKVLFDEISDSRAVTGLPHFGESVAGNNDFLWLARPEHAPKAILYLHGGGYSNPLAMVQLAGMAGVWYALDFDTRYQLAIAVLDYSLTSKGHYFPTQIFEAVAAYRKLVELGYEVVLFGDSCGANLALAVARFAAYPEEARASFSHFSQFSWDFSPLPAPKSMVLVAPWISPSSAAKLYPGVDHSGELLSLNINEKGKLYTKGTAFEEAAPWAEFGETNYEQHWAKVPAIKNGSVLYIYGEREVFRESQERFAAECRLATLMQPGGIHDNLFVVESLGLKKAMYSRAMEKGGHRRKWNFGHIAEFLRTVGADGDSAKENSLSSKL